MSGRVFSTLQFAAACGLRPQRARLILEGFEEIGVVERRGRKWAATRYGLDLSRGLALTAPVTLTEGAR